LAGESGPRADHYTAVPGLAGDSPRSACRLVQQGPYNLYATHPRFRGHVINTTPIAGKLAAFAVHWGRCWRWQAGSCAIHSAFLVIWCLAWGLFPAHRRVYIAAYYIASGRGEPQVRRAWRVDSPGRLARGRGWCAVLRFSISGVTAVFPDSAGGRRWFLRGAGISLSKRGQGSNDACGFDRHRLLEHHHRCGPHGA